MTVVMREHGLYILLAPVVGRCLDSQNLGVFEHQRFADDR